MDGRPSIPEKPLVEGSYPSPAIKATQEMSEHVRGCDRDFMFQRQFEAAKLGQKAQTHIALALARVYT